MGKLELTTEQADTIRSLWNNGLRRDEIAAAAGLTVDSLIAAKRELNLPRLRQSGGRVATVDPTHAEIREACAEIRKTWTVEEHAIRQGYRPLQDFHTEAARKHRIVPIRDVVAAWEP